MGPINAYRSIISIVSIVESQYTREKYVLMRTSTGALREGIMMVLNMKNGKTLRGIMTEETVYRFLVMMLPAMADTRIGWGETGNNKH
jgi:hypothetical protein